MRTPDVRALAEPERSPTLREVAERWQASRKDVRDSTRIQHRTALGRVLPLLGIAALDAITADHVQEHGRRAQRRRQGAGVHPQVRRRRSR